MESADMTWRKSTYSTGGSSNCVEVGTNTAVLVRDTKNNGAGPVLAFPADAWADFTASIK
jgi:hypothetical protein